MGDIGYGYGSEWHLLRYLGRHRHELNERIERHEQLKNLEPKVVDWCDFEYGNHWTLDRERQQVDFLPRECPARQEWPRALKPSWDAIGTIRLRYPEGPRNEWLLVEAKAHTGEFRCDPKTAGGKSKDRIRPHLHGTRDRIGAKDQDWLGKYYQFANRLFTLDHLNRHDEPARLLLIYFCRDQCTNTGSLCPQDADGWKAAIAQMYGGLGITNGFGPLADRVHTLFLPVSKDQPTPRLQRGFNWPSPRPPRGRSACDQDSTVG